MKSSTALLQLTRILGIVIALNALNNSLALGVMQLTNTTKNGIVKGNALCFTATHLAPKNKAEKQFNTNTKKPIGCEFQVKPLVLLDGKRGLTRKIASQVKHVVLKYGKKNAREICFDFSKEISQIKADKNARSLKLLGIGELDTACVPAKKTKEAFAKFAPEAETEPKPKHYATFQSR